MSGEVVYDKNAMNNAYNLLVTANSNLELAKGYYNNEKLSGSSLVSSAESVMNNVEQAIARATEALASIDVGMGSINTDFSGSNTVMTQAGVSAEIPFSDIEALFQANSGMATFTFLTGNEPDVMDQDILDMVFFQSYTLSPESKQWLLSFFQTYRDVLAPKMVQNGISRNLTDAYGWLNEMIDFLSKHDSWSFDNDTWNILSSLFSYANIEPNEIIDFTNGLTFNKGDVKIQEEVVKYMSDRYGISSKDVYKMFQSCYNRTAGGICGYGVLCEIIGSCLTEEQIMDHYGIEKYVTLDNGRTVLNPAILADMVFQMNHEGGAGANVNNGATEYDFVNENGEWKLKSGGLSGSSFGTVNFGIDIDRVNRYLESVGLRLNSVYKRNGGKQILIGSIEGVRKEYRMNIEQALEDGHQVALCFGSYTRGDPLVMENIGTGAQNAVNGRSLR